MRLDEKPVVGITMGDPAGIGPEIVAKALSNSELYDISRPLVIGSAAMIRQAAEALGLDVKVNGIMSTEDALYTPGTIDVYEATEVLPNLVETGLVQASAGQVAFDCIKTSIKLGMAGEIDVVATAPINKEAIKAAGIPFIGHTEIYADITNSAYALTMFAVKNLRVFFLSRHLSLRNACAHVTKENVLETLHQMKAELSKLNIENPKIAVAALNPHAGDGGLFGDEDQREVAPAIQQAVKDGINAVGPVPADSVFHLGLQGRYDAILSLYHDQGHIATKTLDFERTISVTLGLPFVRTSVDHGTAFDIAGRGIASSVSMEEAIRLAARYSMLQKGLVSGI